MTSENIVNVCGTCKKCQPFSFGSACTHPDVRKGAVDGEKDIACEKYIPGE